MDREQFAAAMFILGAAYERQLNQDAMEVYYSFLKHLSPEKLEAAARRHISRSSYFPKINELLEASRENQPSPIEAWQQLIVAAKDGEKDPNMDSPTRQALAFIGGWEAFNMLTYDDLKFRFKDFQTAYLEALARVESASQEITYQSSVAQIEGLVE